MSRHLLSLMLAGALFVLALPLTLAATPATADLLSSGRADEAVAALRLHLQASPDDAEAHALLLRAYYAMQRWDEAIASGQKAVTLDPNNSRYHMWLGRALGEKADHSSWVTAITLAKKTRTEFETAVALNGSNVDARADLAEFYVEAPSFLGGSKEKAQAQADRVLALGNEPTALWIRARIAEADKSYALAEQQLRAAILASHNNPDFILNLASFYRRRGRMIDVENTVNQAVEAAARSHHNHILLDGAELLYRAGRNFTGALQMLRNYISLPQHSEDAPVFQAYYLQGVILEKLGNKRAAAEQYRAALSLASSFEPAQSALKRLD